MATPSSGTKGEGINVEYVDGKVLIQLMNFTGSIILKNGNTQEECHLAPIPSTTAITTTATTAPKLANTPSSSMMDGHDATAGGVVKSPPPSVSSVVTPSTSGKAKGKGTNKRAMHVSTSTPGGDNNKENSFVNGGDSHKKIKSTPPGDVAEKSPTIIITKPPKEEEEVAGDIEGLDELDMGSQQDRPTDDITQAGTPTVSLQTLPAKSTSLPPGRWGHTATLVGDKMFVFGGQGDDEQGQDLTFGDLFIYDKSLSTWDKPINCESSPRVWHSTTYIPDKNLLFIFGGERTSGKQGDPPEVLGDILLFDTEILLFYPPAISGKEPSPRSGHSSSLVGRDILIFGGSRGRKWVSTVSALNIDRWQWRVPSIKGEAPKGRSYHSATVINKDVVLFGGNDGQMCFNDVHVLKCSNDSAWEWFRPEVVGQPPSKRTGHTACLLQDGKTILIHGGWDPQSETHEATRLFDDAFLLDTESWEWKPGPALADLGYRVGHSALLIKQEEEEGRGRSSVLFLGGQDQMGKRSNELQALNTKQLEEHLA